MTTISYKNYQNTNMRSMAQHKRFRKAVNDKIHAVKYVINRVDISWNAMTKKYEEDRYLAIVDDSPLIHKFGVSLDYRAANVLVFDRNDDDEKGAARRINIDGQKYVYCESLMIIQCDNKRKINELSNKGYMLDDKLYVAATASPSNEKHATKYYALICEETPDEEAIYDKINELMGGALDFYLTKKLSKNQILNTLVTGAMIAKANTRIGNYASGMACLSKIDLKKERIAYVNGSISQACDFDEETREQMLASGIDIDTNINDGGAFVTPEKIMEMAASVGVKLTYEAALRIAIQSRWDVLNTKVMVQPRCTEDLERMAEFYGATIYGNPNGPLVALVDKDGAKMVNFEALMEGTTEINMYVLAVANASGVKTCGQHLIKYMSIDPEQTLELVSYYTKLAVDDFVANKLESEDGGYSVNHRIMAKLAPEEVIEDSYLMESLYSDTFKYVQSMIANIKLPIDGVYTHMAFDLSYALTNGLVNNVLGITPEGFVEAYNPDVLDIYAEEIKAIEEDDTLTEDEKDEELFKILSAVVIKFPSAMPDEYEIIVYKTEKQIKKMIMNKVAEVEGISNEEKAMLKDILEYYFDHAYFGCTIYSPINAMKNKLAGADIDFDATMCDMSEFKFIAINKRIEEAQEQPGYMGRCTVIVYGNNVVRKTEEQTTVAEEDFSDVEDIDVD